MSKQLNLLFQYAYKVLNGCIRKQFDFFYFLFLLQMNYLGFLKYIKMEGGK